ncbi:MAG TPA: pyridoxamine 5'-phosphate oxidase family protein [Kineosporiaceae bacterium]|nr:pyridoxamine 5'-phosphate oxidase family protein [Kineosporiaceae bacterium]
MSEIKHLGVDTCWDLLRSVQVGRLAVIVGERPEIFPVNHVVDRGTIIFRTADGTKLAGALGGAPVAFEVDGYDEDAGEAWSVVAKGQAEEIRQLHDVMDTVDLPLEPWHGEPKHRFIRIEPEEVSGRRFAVSDPAGWESLLRRAPRAPHE